MFMYSNKLAIAIKSSGKVLREFDDQVFLPFGSEYSLFIKNKNSVRASVKVEIDGTDVTQGVSLVVDPNDEIELERFIRNGNLSQGNRFKFIERTTAVEKHRGIKVDDGLVRVSFQFERPQERYLKGYPTWDYMNIGSIGDTGNFNNVGRGYSSSVSGSLTASGAVSSNAISPGITAPGSVSSQEFNTVNSFPLELQRHVIVLRLVGEVLGKSVTNSVTTRSRSACVTCGHLSKSNARFCSQCGTSLNMYELSTNLSLY
jgi:hypothetical protein